jgi:hypothetical protein
MNSHDPKAERYWIAINGASCAMSGVPFTEPKVTPTPRQLIGFPTIEEAAEAQDICLREPMDAVVRFFESLRPDIDAGRVRVINPAHPQRSTRGQTAWTENADVHEVVQQNFIKTASN